MVCGNFVSGNLGLVSPDDNSVSQSSIKIILIRFHISIFFISSAHAADAYVVMLIVIKTENFDLLASILLFNL